MLPPALGLTVVHHQIGVSQLSRRAEIENAILNRALENERAIAERAIGNGYGHTPDNIIHDLVPDQNAQRVGARIVADDERDDRFRVAETGRPSGCSAAVQPLEARRVNRRNPVLGRAARLNLLQRDNMLREICARPLGSPTSSFGRGLDNSRNR